MRQPTVTSRKVHVTACKNCGQVWYNEENRDYSNDKCGICGRTVEDRGVQDIRVTKGPIPTATLANDFPEGIE